MRVATTLSNRILGTSLDGLKVMSKGSMKKLLNQKGEF